MFQDRLFACIGHAVARKGDCQMRVGIRRSLLDEFKTRLKKTIEPY